MDFIRTNKKIEVHIERRNFPGFKRYFNILADSETEESLDITTVLAVRFNEVHVFGQSIA